MRIFLIFMSFLWVLSARSQELKFCGYNSALESLFKEDPAAKKRVQELENISSNALNRSQAIAAYTIPVVFHIIHKGGSENISDAQIKSAIAILNRDFQKQNADTANIVPQFKNIAADCQIQFSLATLDENGFCTNGITRHYDNRTNWTVSSSSYAYTWDPTKYLNIYVVKTLQNGAAGYTYLPGSVGGVMDAIVVLHNYTGNTGTANNYTSRTLTHEVGHWLNLPHIWGGTNSPGVACGDDGVSDTPITKGHSNCNLNNAITCNAGVTENIQNYMEYSYCTNMFTIGQRTRMHNALNSAVAGRNNLSDPANLVATGIIDPNTMCAPKADFVNSTTVTCVGGSLNFTDYSYNSPVDFWKWSSPSASNTSTLQNGNLTFINPGIASVQLKVSNSVGSDSLVKNSVVVMAGAGSGTVNLTESFETDTFPNMKWIATKPQFGSAFISNTTTAASGTACIWVNNYFDNPNGPVAVFSPAYDLTNSIAAALEFKYAYAQQSSLNDDVLKVSVSVNCGQTWTSLFSKAGSALNTTGMFISSNYLTPQTSEWKSEQINLLSYSGNSKVYFKFEFTPDASSPGNNIFIDDINISQTVGLKKYGASSNIKLYPNPASNELSIEGTEVFTEVNIYDYSGRLVQTEPLSNKKRVQCNIKDLSPGLYIVTISTESGKFLHRFIKQ